MTGVTDTAWIEQRLVQLNRSILAGDVPNPEPAFLLDPGTLPSGAAVSGIRSQREHLRNSERFEQMLYYLEGTKARMETAPDLETVRAVAADAEDLMLQENRDWFIVMKFHDFELHV